ncbi:MAG: PBP1A family penicillin-binding protein [bacterium]
MSKEKIIKIVLISFFVLLAALAGLFLQILHQLPDVNSITSYTPSESTIIYATDGTVLARLHREENRRIVPLSKISPFMQKSVISTEDPTFYRHHGFDFYSIFRATLKNLAYGRIVEGGSTITQQLARNVFLSRRKALTRKFGELILALQLERRYTKNEILEMYLNQVYYGHNAYGIESAASLYFNKKAAELSLAESAMLAGLIRGPELYSPYRNFKGAKKKQIQVLNNLLSQKYVSEEEAQAAAIVELEFAPKNLKRLGEIAPYFISHILKDLIETYGEETVYHDGLRVYTTLDPQMQTAAEEVITRFASSEGTKYNFTQSALVSLDPRTGYIKSLVGGVDFYESKFNRVTQAKRQPGSSFKPFVYSAAMEQGISPGAIFVDELTTFEVYPNEWNPEGTWTPQNFTEKFYGPVTLRHAFEKSLNIPSIKILERVGISSAIGLARRMGITSHLEPGLALTLGASEVTLLEMTSAYSPFANSGIRVEPATIKKIENRNGVTLYKHTIKEKQVIDPNIAAVMVDLMAGVLTRGTGVHGQIGRPAAAKTGTSQDFKDAWFIGYVPQLVTGVWVGNDDNTSMEGVAEVAVGPRIWKEYNIRALANTPVLDFPKPEGLKTATICLSTGQLALPVCPEELQRTEKFWAKDVPKEKCQIHQEMFELFDLKLWEETQ